MSTARRAAYAIVALLVAWIAVPAAVPLYDGPGQPDQPYRYVNDKATWKPNGPPSAVHTTLAVHGGVVTPGGFANSTEILPQVGIYFPAGSLRAPDGAASLDVAVTPTAPSGPAPSAGRIVTNVYVVKLTASTAGPIAFVGKGDSQTPVLQMRAPSARQPGPVFEHLVNGKWVQSDQTTRVGQDVYQTFAPDIAGSWALVQVGGGSSGSPVATVLLVVGVGILALVGILLAIRFFRSRNLA